MLLAKVAFHGEVILGKMFEDEACRQARPCCEVAVVDGGNEGGLDRAEVCIVKVLGKFEVGNVIAENTICLIWIGALW